MISRLFLVLAASLVFSGCLPTIGRDQVQNQIEQFAKGKIVKGFPALPLYPKAQVIESFGGKGAYGASFISSENLGKVVKFYNESLPQLGWDMTIKKQSETNFLFEIKNTQSQGQIIVNTAADGKKTAITISVEPR